MSERSDGGDEGDDESDLLYHVDGELVPADEATVSVRDRGFMYGDAAFETLRAYGGDVFRWGAHADRLRETCDVLSLDHGVAADDLKARVDETLRANELEDAYVRLSVTRGVQPGKLTPEEAVDPTVVVVATPLPRGGRGSDPVWDGPASLQTVKTRRVPDRSIPARAKTHNYLNGILARLELRVTDVAGQSPAGRRGSLGDADEAVMLDSDGHLAEGATSNLFFVRDDALCTPSLDGPVLPGVTRAEVVDVAAAEEIPVREGSFTPDDLRDASEAFVTNTTWEIRPVESVDGIDVGGGPVTTLLSTVFDARVEREHYAEGGSEPNGR
ncbi:branched-chain amino acid aminotransferase [Halopelagius inordinatus]|uniref:Branched-chain amino acid aminotransferase n=1 Tax=Halopelagius inordinatus TaxID=553467 RepID=A0A1I2MKK7_9EURY|nr:aminotransferase class IV [Halopelagius inordinatus]SFF91450.1 branched-chain amino acid aminotransferase [Halopelagius inordinatus]